MGYKREKTIYNLVFPDMEGLEVKATSTSMGEFQRIAKLAVKLDENPDELSVDDIDALDALFERFAKVLISWNLEDEDGTPVPATKEGLLDQDPVFVMTVVNVWLSTVSSVPASLGKDSNSTNTFPEVSIPMEVASSASPTN
jgi:hypothetical protein